MEAERERLATLSTHSFALADAQKGFEVAGDKARGAVKVTLLP